jgi:hypothetical protein
LVWLRTEQQRQAQKTLLGKAMFLRQFLEFLVLRYQGDIHALAGYMVGRPMDEFTLDLRLTDLRSDDPAQAALVALVAFHGRRTGHLLLMVHHPGLTSDHQAGCMSRTDEAGDGDGPRRAIPRGRRS